MRCPVCETVELSLSERQGIEIDYCPKCRGVWLDRGELDKILERSGGYTRPPSEFGRGSRPMETGHHQQPYPHGKKKSFLSEIFDFD